MSVSVYCIVVAYNGLQWIDQCIKSVINSSISCNIICIDNASTDGTPRFVSKNFPGVQLIQSGTNIGFGQANNIGFRMALAAGADYVFLLNQDATVLTDTIEKLVTAHLKQSHFGIISPVHLNGKGHQLDQYFRNYLASSELPENLDINSFLEYKKDLVIYTNFVNAAAWLLSKACIEKVGGFDPIFFHYGEDNNYVQRTNYHGFKTGIHLGSFIHHDREYQIKQSEITPEKKLQKEWIFFLCNACDINRKAAFLFTSKRFIRHTLLSVANFLQTDKYAFFINSGMAKRIISNAIPIGKSRFKALTSKPFLLL